MRVQRRPSFSPRSCLAARRMKVFMMGLRACCAMAWRAGSLPDRRLVLTSDRTLMRTSTFPISNRVTGWMNSSWFLRAFFRKISSRPGMPT